ncbi:MAG TPA: copper resistance protein CopC [Gemmatimonadaceae bacterium]|nr:copper resistance protein CopC [Gemmatimonadaceae bacterium]
MSHHSFSARTPLAILAAAVVFVAPTAMHGAIARRHAYLVRSEPAAHDTTSAPRAVRLWFSERVELKVTRIKLAHAAGGAVPMNKPAPAGDDADAPIVATVAETLAPGAYTVKWSTAGKDGHPSKGTIDFVVKSAR